MAFRIPFLWVDHRPRIEFYVREGLVSRAPTDAQLSKALGEMASKVGVLGQIIFYAKHPLLIFPTQAKRAFVDNPRADGDDKPYEAPPEDVAVARAAKPALDRFLESLFLFSPARFLVKTLFNPWEAVPSSGINAPTWCIIAHTLQTNHPATAIWDLQVIHPDPGALDDLEQQVDDALAGRSLHARINRALGCQPHHFENLKDLIPRIRRFEYPDFPPGVNRATEDFVSFLNHAADL